MRGRAIGLAAVVLIAGGTFLLSACGSDDETTTVEETATSTTSTSTTSAAEETTPGGAVVPAVPDCDKGEIYSEGSKSCVPIGSGTNPCPEGEAPAADQPACLKE